MFNSIIGNEENKQNFIKIIKNKNISHSYIFSGVSGIGKLLFAKEFAKSVLCLSEDVKPCNKCKSCETFDGQNNPDIIIIDEQKDAIKTEQIKELTNNVLQKPILGSKKVYIINNSENMTKEAQNSLLKTLEEPPEYAIIILVTSNENLLLNTIKSRCIIINFSKLSDDEIRKYLNNNNITIDDKMIRNFNGSIERAKSIIDNIDIYQKVDEAFEQIEDMNELQILRLKDTIFKDKDEIYLILDYINTIFYNKILENIQFSNKYNKCIEIIEETKLRLKKNSNYDMTIDNCLLTLERSLK